jgi:hypothetical protein
VNALAASAVWSTFEMLHSEISHEVRILLRELPHEQYVLSTSDQAVRIAEMQEFAAHAASDEARHNFWVRTLLAQGWKPGPRLDVEARENPMLVLWSELPASFRAKAKIFAICVRYAEALAGVATAGDAP